jgi:hypothetical protein
MSRHVGPALVAPCSGSGRRFVTIPGTVNVATFGADCPGAAASGARIFLRTARRHGGRVGSTRPRRRIAPGTPEIRQLTTRPRASVHRGSSALSWRYRSRRGNHREGSTVGCEFRDDISWGDGKRYRGKVAPCRWPGPPLRASRPHGNCVIGIGNCTIVSPSRLGKLQDRRQSNHRHVGSGA